jgi:hypothetical protein
MKSHIMWQHGVPDCGRLLEPVCLRKVAVIFQRSGVHTLSNDDNGVRDRGSMECIFGEHRDG